jgi:hypothetical protein
MRRILADVWHLDLKVVQAEFTLVGVNPALDQFTDLARQLRQEAEERDCGTPALIEVPDREDAVFVAGLAENTLDFLEELGQPGGHHGRHRLPQRIEPQRGHGEQRLVTLYVLGRHPWRLPSYPGKG